MNVTANETVTLVNMVVLAIMNAYVAGGSKKAILPLELKDTMIGLLTQMMANFELRSMYCLALETERAERGSGFEKRLLGYAGLDIREDEIAARGFVGLTDDELADFAISPEAIRAVADFVEMSDTDFGAWYVEALIKDVAENPRPPEAVRRTKELLHAKLMAYDPAPACAIDMSGTNASVTDMAETSKPQVDGE